MEEQSSATTKIVKRRLINRFVQSILFIMLSIKSSYSLYIQGYQIITGLEILVSAYILYLISKLFSHRAVRAPETEEIISPQEQEHIKEISIQKAEDVQTFNEFFESGRKGIKYDYYLLKRLNHKPPGTVNFGMLKEMRRRLYDYRRDNHIYCEKCDYIRKPISHHCSRTGYCVTEMDEYSDVFQRVIYRGNLSLYVSMQFWVFGNLLFKIFVFFMEISVLFEDEQRFVIKITDMLYIIIAIAIIALILINLCQNITSYMDNLYFIDSLLATSGWKENQKNLGSTKYENLFNILGVSRIRELIFPTIKQTYYDRFYTQPSEDSNEELSGYNSRIELPENPNNIVHAINENNDIILDDDQQ